MKLYCQLLQENAGIKDIFIPKESVDDSFAFCFRESRGPPNNLIQGFIHIHVMYLNTKRKDIFCCGGGIHYSIFVKEKYKNLKNMIDSIFTLDEDKNKMLDIFSKTQRIIFALSKFLYIYRYKKAQVKINSDLCMNEIHPTQKHVFVLFQQKFKYYFIVSDLVNIINRCLINSPFFFSRPLVPKNPYNNIELTKTDMYNIYFFIKSRTCIVPHLIQSLFICNIDYEMFKIENEPMIRESYIHNYVYTNHYTVLYSSIQPMLFLCNVWTKYLKISHDFPKNKLVNIMRPYLHLYYLHLYYIEGTIKKEDSYLLLKKKIRLFVKYNPYFGRKTIKINSNGVNEILFDENCIDFNKEYDESKFKKIKISLTNPFANTRGRYFSTPDERASQISRVEYPEPEVMERPAYFHEPRTPDTSPPVTPPLNQRMERDVVLPNTPLFSNISTLLLRTSLHSIASNAYDEDVNNQLNQSEESESEESEDMYDDDFTQYGEDEDTDNEETEEDDGSV